MGWFSFGKNSNPVEALPQPKTALTPYAWMTSASDKDYQERVSALFTEYSSLHSTESSCWLNNLTPFVEAFILKLRKIDRDRLSRDDRYDIAMILTNFSALIGQMETELTINKGIDYKLYEVLRAKIKNYINIISKMPRKPPTTTIVEDVDKGDGVLGPVAAGRLAEVESLISKVASNAKLSLSVEDEFFIEQSLQSYIPESIRMLKNFNSAPEEMKEQATELFNKQLTSIETRLQRIMEQESKTSLAQMQAHALFLEEKNR